MKIMNRKLLIGMALILSSVGAQAYYCSGECVIRYQVVVGRIPVNSTATQRYDFENACTQNYRGRVQNASGSYECIKDNVVAASVTGQGTDIFQAQANTRSACSQRAASYPNATGNIYTGLDCR